MTSAKKPIEKICEWCGQEFQARSDTVRYCDTCPKDRKSRHMMRTVINYQESQIRQIRIDARREKMRKIINDG